ncbi:MAG: hypothetical protein ACR2PX_18585 [Endozoicomonas sp.]|uniref:hypothetical protein n=1 Tax=Endozoicomonas sp. TaxID=1892382 RepID=UPI003D9B6F03
MVDSVNRSEGVVVPTQTEALKELDQADRVSRGYDTGNSVSARTGGGLVQLPPGASDAPTIPEPDSEVTGEVGDLKKQVAQQTAANLRGQIGGTFGESPISITSTHPELVTPAVGNTVLEIDSKLSRLSDASPEVLSDINSSLNQLHREHREGTLTSDKLDEILAQISASLEDSSVKYSENKIEIASQDAQQRHASNIEHIREHIEEADSAKADSGIIFLKSLALVFPPVLLWETALEIDRDVNPGKDNSQISIFSKNEIDYMEQQEKAAEARRNQQANSYVFVPVQSTGNSEQTDNNQSEGDGNQQPTEAIDEAGPSSSSVGDATEGIQIANEGLDHFERRKLLLQALQESAESEEAKNKLQEAINALESGDPSLAEEILGGFTDSLGLDNSLGDSVSTSTDDTTPPPLPENVPETNDDQAFTPPSREDTTDSVQNEQPDSTPVAPNLTSFINDISSVPDEVLSSQQDAASEQGLIQRHNSV